VSRAGVQGCQKAVTQSCSVTLQAAYGIFGIIPRSSGAAGRVAAPMRVHSSGAWSCRHPALPDAVGCPHLCVGCVLASECDRGLDDGNLCCVAGGVCGCMWGALGCSSETERGEQTIQSHVASAYPHGQVRTVSLLLVRSAGVSDHVSLAYGHCQQLPCDSWGGC
jgi:hypothetical protein